MITTKLKITDVGREAYNNKLMGDREEEEMISIIKGGICPVCGNKLKYISKKWFRIFDYDYLLECPEHGRVYEGSYCHKGPH